MKDEGKLYDQHRENINWGNTLKFYKDELEVLKKRLGEITSKNNNQEMLKEVEHFQNQFIIQRNNIDSIAHDVQMNEDKLQQEIKRNPTAVDRRTVKDHGPERELVAVFEKNMNQIREDFKRFAAKWM